MRWPALVIAWTLVLHDARATEPLGLVDRGEFERLATEFSKKVNLFADVWKQDPNAQFFGGTTRDYLYWLKRQFRSAKTRGEVDQTISRLRSLPSIDIKSFIVAESDIDIATNQPLYVREQTYGVTKFDARKTDLFDPLTEAGMNERLQGHIPVEKIRLSSRGFSAPTDFGDGVGEVHSGKLSIRFATPQEFARSHYARQGLNHEILLSLRFLRLQAMNYFNSHGAGYPDRARLLDIDPVIEKKIKEVVGSATKDPSFSTYLERPKFAGWLNGVLHKGFRAYSNPTAMMELVRHFGVDELVRIYSKRIEPINQYLFAKHRDPGSLKANLQGIDAGTLYEKVDRHFPDGFFYHGTPSEPAFRNILFQGVVGSEKGQAGSGLYGVDRDQVDVAEMYAGDKNRVVKFPVRPDSVVIDIRPGGAGEELFLKSGLGFDQFAERYGADILIYPFRFLNQPPRKAYVVKNSTVLGRGEGVHRKLLPLSDALDLARKLAPGQREELRSVVDYNHFAEAEADAITREFFGRSDVKSDLDTIRYFKELKLSEQSENGAGTRFVSRGAQLVLGTREFNAKLSDEIRTANPKQIDVLLQRVFGTFPLSDLRPSLGVFLDSSERMDSHWSSLLKHVLRRPEAGDIQDELISVVGRLSARDDGYRILELFQGHPAQASLGRVLRAWMDQAKEPGQIHSLVILMTRYDFHQSDPRLLQDLFNRLPTRSRQEFLSELATSLDILDHDRLIRSLIQSLDSGLLSHFAGEMARLADRKQVENYLLEMIDRGDPDVNEAVAFEAFRNYQTSSNKKTGLKSKELFERLIQTKDPAALEAIQEEFEDRWHLPEFAGFRESLDKRIQAFTKSSGRRCDVDAVKRSLNALLKKN